MSKMTVSKMTVISWKYRNDFDFQSDTNAPQIDQVHSVVHSFIHLLDILLKIPASEQGIVM